ncbi:hypothetical protein R6Q57_004620 [Mikania cordata]
MGAFCLLTASPGLGVAVLFLLRVTGTNPSTPPWAALGFSVSWVEAPATRSGVTARSPLAGQHGAAQGQTGAAAHAPKAEEGRGLKIREVGQVSADEAGVYQEVVNLSRCLIKFISKSREDKIRLATTEQKLFDNVQVLKQEITAVRASLQDLSSTKSGAQQSIESSKQRLLFIEKRVPEIESEKRVFATARNFKEAARIANEAKTLYAEKETKAKKPQNDKSEKWHKATKCSFHTFIHQIQWANNLGSPFTVRPTLWSNTPMQKPNCRSGEA